MRIFALAEVIYQENVQAFTLINGDENTLENPAILLFDGVCNLCNGFVRFIIKRDPGKKFKFASLQSEVAGQLLATWNLSAGFVDSVILIQGNKYYTKSTAALRILKETGGFWKIFYVFIVIPKPIRDFFYDIMAKSRYRIFGKTETCMIPEPGVSDRFL